MGTHDAGISARVSKIRLDKNGRQINRFEPKTQPLKHEMNEQHDGTVNSMVRFLLISVLHSARKRYACLGEVGLLLKRFEPKNKPSKHEVKRKYKGISASIRRFPLNVQGMCCLFKSTRIRPDAFELENSWHDLLCVFWKSWTYCLGNTAIFTFFQFVVSFLHL